MVCTACEGRSPTRSQADAVFEATGDTWGVCGRCANSHRDPAAPASYTDEDLAKDLNALWLDRWAGE